jgi:hypothetical protein
MSLTHFNVRMKNVFMSAVTRRRTSLAKRGLGNEKRHATILKLCFIASRRNNEQREMKHFESLREHFLIADNGTLPAIK